MSRRQRGNLDLADRVPRRVVDHELDADGRVVLLRPKHTRGLLARWLQPRLRHKHYRLKLDDIGAATWRAIDGRRTVAEIGDVLYDRFGEAVEPRLPRTSLFISTLCQGDLVALDPREG